MGKHGAQAFVHALCLFDGDRPGVVGPSYGDLNESFRRVGFESGGVMFHGCPSCSVVFEDVVVAGYSHFFLFAAQLGHVRRVDAR